MKSFNAKAQRGEGAKKKNRIIKICRIYKIEAKQLNSILVILQILIILFFFAPLR